MGAMQPPSFRSVSLISTLVISGLLSGCSADSSQDSSKFERWADQVSTLPLLPEDDMPRQREERVDVVPASDGKIRVELMTPHQLWDAREGPIKVPSTMDMVEASAPVIAAAAARQAAPSAPPATVAPAPRPAVVQSAPPAAAPSSKLIQLGAFGTQDGAKAAWTRISGQNARLRAITPRYEPVVVGERTLVRLRVNATPDQAQILCQAAALNDPWCRQPQ